MYTRSVRSGGPSISLLIPTAPSPGTTASLAISNDVLAMAEKSFELKA